MALTADSFRDSLCRVIFSGILLRFRDGRPTDVTDFNDLLVSSGSGKAILQAVQATDSADSARISRELLLLTR